MTTPTLNDLDEVNYWRKALDMPLVTHAQWQAYCEDWAQAEREAKEVRAAIDRVPYLGEILDTFYGETDIDEGCAIADLQVSCAHVPAEAFHAAIEAWCGLNEYMRVVNGWIVHDYPVFVPVGFDERTGCIRFEPLRDHVPGAGGQDYPAKRSAPLL